jgi:N-acetylmuramoyl-L-alanine amidase
MIFLSAGHNAQSKSIKADPGAINKHGIKEGDLTIEFRDLVAHELDILGIKYITDLKEESLQMYVDRIQTGNGSVVIEYHFDAAAETATGCTTLTEIDADRLDKACAKELSDITASILGIKNRGVKTEADTRHGRLALMKEDGIVVLHEICFITNEDDLTRYNLKKKELAKAHANILSKYEAIIP